MDEPQRNAFTPTTARQILDLRLSEETQRRVDFLAEKCTAGTLTEEERLEYDKFAQVSNALSVLQAQARTYLENQ